MISRRNFRRNSKGIGTVFGMVFFLLIVMIVFASFVIILTQSTNLEQTITQTRQLDSEAASEQVRIFTAPGNTQFFTNIGSSSVTLSCNVNNTGTVPIQIVRLWVEDLSTNVTGSTPISYVIPQGQVTLIPPTTVSLSISDTKNDILSFWFVTARGNLFNQYTNQGPQGPPGNSSDTAVTALVATSVGSILMNYMNFCFYQPSSTSNGTNIGTKHTGFNIPNSGSANTIFCVNVTNLDPSQQIIYLQGSSYLWGQAPHAGTLKQDQWNILNVTQSKIINSPSQQAAFTSLALPYNQTILLYFGPNQAGWTQGYVAPMFLLLYGTTGSSSYGQNIPFIALDMQ